MHTYTQYIWGNAQVGAGWQCREEETLVCSNSFYQPLEHTALCSSNHCQWQSDYWSYSCIELKLIIWIFYFISGCSGNVSPYLSICGFFPFIFFFPDTAVKYLDIGNVVLFLQPWYSGWIVKYKFLWDFKDYFDNIIYRFKRCGYHKSVEGENYCIKYLTWNKLFRISLGKKNKISFKKSDSTTIPPTIFLTIIWCQSHDHTNYKNHTFETGGKGTGHNLWKNDKV